MKITAVLLGMHRAFLPPGARQSGRVTIVSTGDEVSLRYVLAELEMPVETPRIVLLDGEAIGDEHLLHDGDTVTFLSPLGGG